MTARAVGWGAAALGVLLGVAPFLDWYRAALPERSVTYSGVEVAGELWTLPALALVTVGLGVALAVLRPDPRWTPARWIGGALATAGIFALVWTLRAVLDIQAEAIPVDVVAPPRAPLTAQPFSFLAAAVGAAIASAGFAWLRDGAD